MVLEFKRILTLCLIASYCTRWFALTPCKALCSQGGAYVNKVHLFVLSIMENVLTWWIILGAVIHGPLVHINCRTYLLFVKHCDVEVFFFK